MRCCGRHAAGTAPDRCDGGKDSVGDTATADCEKTTNVP